MKTFKQFLLEATKTEIEKPFTDKFISSMK